MNWGWDSPNWKKSSKILLLLATLWPVIYMVLFFAVVLTMISLTSLAATSGRRNCGYLDALQLDRKIREGEIKQLQVQRDQFIATSRLDDCEYEVIVSNDSSRKQILRDARELVDYKPRVDIIDEKTSQPATPAPFAALGFFGFLVLMTLHMGTIILMTAQMPFYIVLAVKNDRLDQTKKIMWIVLFAVVSLFACPVYWYWYVWRKAEPRIAAVPEGL